MHGLIHVLQTGAAGYGPYIFYDQIQSHKKTSGTVVPHTRAKVVGIIATIVHTQMMRPGVGGMWHLPGGSVHFEQIVLLALVHVSKVRQSFLCSAR